MDYVFSGGNVPSTPSYKDLCLSIFKGVSRQAFLLEQMPVTQYTRIKEIRRSRGSRASGAGTPLEAIQLQQVFDRCKLEGTVYGKRDLAIIGLLYGVGLRRADISTLRYPDNINFNDATITVISKGDKERTIPMPDVLEAWLLDYIECRGTLPGPLIQRIRKTKDSYKLTGDKVSGQAVYNVCLKRGAEANIERFTPHDYRRTYGTELLESGESIKDVQLLLGHTSITTTQRYTRSRKTADQQKQVVNNLGFGK